MNAESHRCVSLYLLAYHYSLERIESEMHGITYYGATTLNTPPQTKRSSESYMQTQSTSS